MTALCKKCGHEIQTGQLCCYVQRRYIASGSYRRVLVHVACPTERQIRVARLWGRWT